MAREARSDRANRQWATNAARRHSPCCTVEPPEQHRHRRLRTRPRRRRRPMEGIAERHRKNGRRRDPGQHGNPNQDAVRRQRARLHRCAPPSRRAGEHRTSRGTTANDSENSPDPLRKARKSRLRTPARRRRLRLRRPIRPHSARTSGEPLDGEPDRNDRRRLQGRAGANRDRGSRSTRRARTRNHRTRPDRRASETRAHRAPLHPRNGENRTGCCIHLLFESNTLDEGERASAAGRRSGS